MKSCKLNYWIGKTLIGAGPLIVTDIDNTLQQKFIPFLFIFSFFSAPPGWTLRWLVSQGKIDKAITILKKFERINKTNVKPELYKDFADSCSRLHQEELVNSSYSIMDLFRTPRLRKITITLIVIWMAMSLVFDGHVRNVGSLGLNIFTTFTVAAATELPADILLTLSLDRWGRRWYACGAMVFSGVFSLFATAVPMGLYSAILAIIGRFFANIAYSIGKFLY